MEQQNSAGIYLKQNHAIAIVHSAGKNSKKLRAVPVSCESEDENSIGGLLSEKLKSENLSADNYAMAVDCSYYIQHKIHSQFTDYRQISQTVKFDAEEILATDILKKAIAFEVNETGNLGSEVSIYSADKNDLADILSDFKTNKTEPVIMEPDVVCLQRFVSEKLKKEADLKDSVTILISDDRCYMINFSEKFNKPLTRTFLTSKNEDKTKLLQRQIPLTLAGFSRELDGLNVVLADTTGTVDVSVLGQKLGINIKSVSINQHLPEKSEDIGSIDLAIAYGSYLSKDDRQAVDFRKDFSPYLGRRQAIENTLKFMAVIVSIVLVAVGAYFQIEAMKKADHVKKAEEKLYEEAVMILPKRRLDRTRESIVSLLNREIVKLTDEKSGLLTLEEGSIEAKLNFVLEAINSTPTTLGLNIETIDVSQRSIRIIGDTNSSQSTLIFFDAIKKHPQLILDERSSKTSSGRNNFRVTIRPAN